MKSPNAKSYGGIDTLSHKGYCSRWPIFKKNVLKMLGMSDPLQYKSHDNHFPISVCSPELKVRVSSLIVCVVCLSVHLFKMFIFFYKITRPSSTNQIILKWEIQVWSREGPRLFPYGDKNEIKSTTFKRFLQNHQANFNLTWHRVKRFKFVHLKDHILFKENLINIVHLYRVTV